MLKKIGFIWIVTGVLLWFVLDNLGGVVFLVVGLYWFIFADDD